MTEGTLNRVGLSQKLADPIPDQIHEGIGYPVLHCIAPNLTRKDLSLILTFQDLSFPRTRHPTDERSATAARAAWAPLLWPRPTGMRRPAAVSCGGLLGSFVTQG